MMSVIIPVYNAEKYLSQCLNSVINQNLQDIEIICVNDGSEDNSLGILNHYSKLDKRIKIINQENRGIGVSRNIALNQALGDYVLFVDSDDFLNENVLEILYSNAISNDSDLVMFKFNLYDDTENRFVEVGFQLDNLFGNKDYENFIFSYKHIKKYVLNSSFAAWSKLYKKKFLDKFNLSFQEGIFYEDVLFHVESLVYASSISFLPHSIYNYRISNPNSIMNSNQNVFDIIKVCYLVENFLFFSSLLNEFKIEFIIFKISQLHYYIGKSKDEHYFNCIKYEFLLMKNSYDENFNKILPEKQKKMFFGVLNSENLKEYLKN